MGTMHNLMYEYMCNKARIMINSYSQENLLEMDYLDRY